MCHQVDFSQYDFPCEIWLVKPTPEITYKSLILSTIIVFGIYGNFLLLNVIVRNRALQTPTNLLLANMIAADTFTLLLCPFFFVCDDFFQNFILGPVGCKLDPAIQGFFHLFNFSFCELFPSLNDFYYVATILIASILSLCAVSYDRLTAIVMPMESRITMHGAKIIIILTWLAGSIIAVPLFIYRYYKVSNRFIGIC